MIVTYSAQAIADLAGIANYLNPRNPAASIRVAAAIRLVIDDLAVHPRRGRRQASRGVRKVVQSTYGYLIYYHVDDSEGVITVLSICHHAQARPFDDV